VRAIRRLFRRIDVLADRVTLGMSDERRRNPQSVFRPVCHAPADATYSLVIQRRLPLRLELFIYIRGLRSQRGIEPSDFLCPRD